MTKNSNEQQVDRIRRKLEMKSLGIVQKVEGEALYAQRMRLQ